MSQTLIKYIRDGVKSNYVYADSCKICGSHENLEFHHYYTLFYLLEEFLKTNEEPLTNEQKLVFREKFINIYWNELVVETVTLCESHHTLLHKLYGSRPELYTSSKQKKWVELQGLKQKGLYKPVSGLAKFKV